MESRGGAGQKGHAPLSPARLPFEPNVGIENSVDTRIPEIALNVDYLESKRIIAHDDKDPRSKPFDMLRTQVLQPMDQKGWKILGITSPTPGCGKTVTAINLAFSIARQPDRSVLLVDLDLQKPQVANSIGVKRESGVVSVLEGRTSLSNAIIQARVGNHRVMVLPVENSTSGSSALVTSRAMSALLQEIPGPPRLFLISRRCCRAMMSLRFYRNSTAFCWWLPSAPQRSRRSRNATTICSQRKSFALCSIRYRSGAPNITIRDLDPPDTSLPC